MTSVTHSPQPDDETLAKAGFEARNAMVVQFLDGVRESLGLEKKEIADRAGVTPRTLYNWMKRASKLEVHEVEALAEALEMSAEQRKILYILTGKLPPEPPVTELRRTPEMALYQSMIDGLEHPSVVYQGCYDVVLTNQPYRDVFGSVRPHATAHPLLNTSRFIFFHPDARTLLGAGDESAFRQDWLMPALAHLSANMQQRPQDPRLKALEDEVLARPTLLRAYRQAPGWIAENQDIVINPSARRFWDPRVGKVVDAHVITEAHQGYQGLSLQRATFIFRDRQPATRTDVAAGAAGPPRP